MSTHASSQRSAVGKVERRNERTDTPPQQVRSTLHELMHRNVDEHNIVFGGFLSNHLTHVLISQAALGGTSERLREYYELYEKETGYGGLEPAEERGVKITTENWREYLGQSKEYLAYVDFFRSEEERHGQQRTLQKYFDALMRGVTCAALHPLIEIGLRVKAHEEVAPGLAYLAFAYDQLPESYLQRPSEEEEEEDDMERTKQQDLKMEEEGGAVLCEDATREKQEEGAVHDEEAAISMLEEALRQLHDDERVESQHLEHESRFVRRLEGALKSAHYLRSEYVQRFDAHRYLAESTWRVLWSAALRLYAATDCRDFFLLHGVTGLNATHYLLPLLREDQRRELLHQLWSLLVLLYVAQRKPQLLDLSAAITAHEKERKKMKTQEQTEKNTAAAAAAGEEEAARWDEAKRRALAHNDEHVVKLVEATYHHRCVTRPAALALFAAESTLEHINSSNDYRF